MIYYLQTRATSGNNIQTQLDKNNLEADKNDADNNRSDLLFNPYKFMKINENMGNWPYSYPHVKVPASTPFYLKSPPQLAGLVDWTDEGSQFLKSKEFRENYVQRWRNAYSTELSHALTHQLVNGYWSETINKGSVLFHVNKADGKYNPEGVNLYLYN